MQNTVYEEKEPTKSLKLEHYKTIVVIVRRKDDKFCDLLCGLWSTDEVMSG